MITSDIAQLEGRNVLVTSSADKHNPPTGRMGTLHVLDSGESGPARVEVVLEFPDMFSEPAHRRVIMLEGREIDKLMASERAGAYELHVDTPIDQTS